MNEIEYEIVSPRDQDIGRGTALLITGAVMVLLTWVLPWSAPLAIGAYGIYRIVQKQYKEGLIFVLVGVAFWFLRKPVEWLLWLTALGIVGLGLFFLIRGMRSGEGGPAA
ncbi:MAG: hypothetical protein OEZ59_03955 [Deltaproteobacteria bacterium]|nr:hypothetical protein [Deltaproteobacteria bacterium]